MLPVDPKLGKMLIMGAVFCCLDPVLTVVSGLSVRDPFLLPQDKKDVSLLFAHLLVLLRVHTCFMDNSASGPSLLPCSHTIKAIEEKSFV